MGLLTRWKFRNKRKRNQRKAVTRGGDDSVFKLNNGSVGLFYPWHSEKYLPHPVPAEHVFAVIYFIPNLIYISHEGLRVIDFSGRTGMNPCSTLLLASPTELAYRLIKCGEDSSISGFGRVGCLELETGS